MKALMRRIIMLGGVGLLVSLIGTACTLTGANAVPLTQIGAEGGFLEATATEMGLPVPMTEPPVDPFADLTATALYDPFAPQILETPTEFAPPGFATLEVPGGEIIPGMETATPFDVTPFGLVPTVTPFVPLPLTPTFDPLAPVFSTPVPTTISTGCPPTYTVQSGDNLYRIALRFGLTYQQLAAANGITNPDVLPVGTVLNIPGCGGNAAPAAGSGSSTSGGSAQPLSGDTVDANGDILHTVKSGENLFRIALSYGLDWQKVAAYNGITDPNNISVGQVIRIPRG